MNAAGNGALRRASRGLARHYVLLALAGIGRSLAKNAPSPKADGQVLLIRPDHVGDLLFTTPALRRLKAGLPEAPITCLVGAWAADVVARNPHVAEVARCDFPWFRGTASGPAHRYGLLMAEARRLRRRGYAAAVNLRCDFWWGAALAYLAGIPYRLGYGTRDCRPFLSAALPYRVGRHEVLQNVTLVEHLIAAAGGRHQMGRDEGHVADELEYPVSAGERAFADRYLAAHEAAGIPLLVIHPGSRAPVKRWPAERFAQVANRLAPRLGAHMLITGGRSERDLAERVAAGISAPATVCAGETSLGELAALLERANLVVGVDSGPLHLAVALGRPTVHLFGPADHRSFGPFGPPDCHVVIRAALPCSPCGRLDWRDEELGHHDCMAAIDVEQVVQGAEMALESERSAKTRQNGEG